MTKKKLRLHGDRRPKPRTRSTGERQQELFNAEKLYAAADRREQEQKELVEDELAEEALRRDHLNEQARRKRDRSPGRGTDTESGLDAPPRRQK
jgi:hypothetical protein